MASNPTNGDIARALGVSEARVSHLARKMGMPRDSVESALAWYRATIDPIRSLGQRAALAEALAPPLPVAEPPGGARAPSLAEERAALAKAQRERIEMQNALTRGELAPTAAIEVVLARAGARVAGILDAIPGMLRRRVPALTAADLDLVAQEIAKARNIAAAVTLADLEDDPAQGVDAEDGPPPPVLARSPDQVLS